MEEEKVSLVELRPGQFNDVEEELFDRQWMDDELFELREAWEHVLEELVGYVTGQPYPIDSWVIVDEDPFYVDPPGPPLLCQVAGFPPRTDADPCDLCTFLDCYDSRGDDGQFCLSGLQEREVITANILFQVTAPTHVDRDNQRYQLPASENVRYDMAYAEWLRSA
jgi:hypothetical protein